jgi:hypothetical protein
MNLPYHAYASLQFAHVPAVATFHFLHEPFAQPKTKQLFQYPWYVYKEFSDPNSVNL